MPMVTTCPHCATSFNVEPGVLLSRNGRVRCGQCKQIFDGLLTATTFEAFQAVADAAAGANEAEPPPTPASIDAERQEKASEEAPVAADVEDYWPPLPAVPEVPPPPNEIARVTEAALLPAPETLNAADVFHGDKESLDFGDTDSAPPANRARWRWALAAGVAALLLGGQVLYRYRSELSANVPVTKPVLVQLCAWAGCAVPPLQQPAALNIEASDLQVVDKAQPHLVQLTATLRNRAAIDVGYPAFDLVLTDNREHALARRVILPADYLPGANIGNAASATIAANAETTLRIDMDIGGLPAAGFRLNLMPAPTH